MEAAPVEKISNDIASILSDPEESKTLARIGAEPAYQASSQFKSFTDTEMNKYSAIVEEADIEKHKSCERSYYTTKAVIPMASSRNRENLRTRS